MEETATISLQLMFNMLVAKHTKAGWPESNSKDTSCTGRGFILIQEISESNQSLEQPLQGRGRVPNAEGFQDVNGQGAG